jgi:hypothetical protein
MTNEQETNEDSEEKKLKKSTRDKLKEVLKQLELDDTFTIFTEPKPNAKGT